MFFAGLHTHMGIKENWNKVDKVCEKCGQVTERQKGITKQNLRRLITPRFDFNEILFTIIIILVLILAFAYKNETQQARDVLNNLGDICLTYNNNALVDDKFGGNFSLSNINYLANKTFNKTITIKPMIE